MSDLISVIIPVFNAEKYVAKCIHSILKQTYSNLDVLIIDDGSTDKSGVICDSFKDNRITVYHNDNNGLSKSRQFGIDRAKGSFFVTIDADDWVLPDYISKLYHSIIENNSDVSICNRYDFYGKRKKAIIKDGVEKSVTVTKIMLESNYRSICAKYGLSDSWDKMYRLDFVRSTGVEFNLPKGYNGNDLSFNYRLILHCPKYSIVNDPLLMHRLTKGSMVRSPNEHLTDGFIYIIKQLKEEASLCGFGDNLNGELSKTFVLFARLSFLYYCRLKQPLPFYIKKAYSQFSYFVKESGFLSLSYCSCDCGFNEDLDQAFVAGDIDKLLKLARKYRAKNWIKRLLRML